MTEDMLKKKIDELCEVLLKPESREGMRDLLSDLCTYKEVEQMALRCYAAKLLAEGMTYNEIIAKTELSSATLSRVSRSFLHGSGGYKKYIEVESEEQ